MHNKLFETIDNLYNKYCDIWEDVCNIESHTKNKEGVDAVGKYFVEMAERRGWKTEIFPQNISGDVVVITLNDELSSAPLSLSGHMDTVFPKGVFPTPSVRRDNENIYGPGVMDCKGGIVAAFLAMDALYECGYKKRPVMLLLQSDEENGSTSSNQKTINTICEKAKNSVAFLNLEGIRGNTAVLERKGIIRFLYKIKGKAVHSARCHTGVNAITEAAYKIIELEKMKDADGITCNCGIINGGTAPNTVAEECEFTADFRFSTKEELELIRKETKRISDTVFLKGCTTEVSEMSFRPSMPYSEKNYKLLEKINVILNKVSLPELTARKNPSGSDAAYATQYGIPCIDSIGTEGYNIHSVDEYSRMESLKESAKRMAASAMLIE